MTATHKLVPDDVKTLDYIARYGGKCRDCADSDGHCPNSGLPCDADEARSTIRHVIDAVNYGIETGFFKLAPPDDLDPTERLPADVRELIIAARIVSLEDQSPEALKRLDNAAEAFAARVPWDDQP